MLQNGTRQHQRREDVNIVQTPTRRDLNTRVVTYRRGVIIHQHDLRPPAHTIQPSFRDRDRERTVA